MSHLPAAKKSLGQHWLTDQTVLSSIVDSADLKSGQLVLEIGPGTGTLTDEILKRGAKVIALEFDSQRAKDLKQKYSNQQILIEQGDIRKYNFYELPKNYKIIANIPYYLTANLFRRLLDETNKPQVAVLLVQKEVAERVVAKLGSYSQISILLQSTYKCELGEVVDRSFFAPPPKVDSQVLKLTKNKSKTVDSEFIKIVKAGFSQPRKKIKTSLSGGLNTSKQAAAKMLESANINPNYRPQELTIADWQNLQASYSQNT